MKKIAVLLSVALVLSLGSAALAADVKVGGEVKYNLYNVSGDKVSPDIGAYWYTTYKLNASGSVSDEVSFVTELSY
ncbi:MAG: hypothetical protein QJR13_07610, partial [Bacillota bacterium]|nr:hypothetical protein [Bacillota bacterium]